MEANKTTEAAISAGRSLLLFAIFVIAIGALLAEPLDDSHWWFEQFFISKVIAAAGFLTFRKLYNRWSKTDKWLKAYNDSCDKAPETPNPYATGSSRELRPTSKTGRKPQTITASNHQ